VLAPGTRVGPLRSPPTFAWPRLHLPVVSLPTSCRTPAPCPWRPLHCPRPIWPPRYRALSRRRPRLGVPRPLVRPVGSRSRPGPAHPGLARLFSAPRLSFSGSFRILAARFLRPMPPAAALTHSAACQSGSRALPLGTANRPCSVTFWRDRNFAASCRAFFAAFPRLHVAPTPASPRGPSALATDLSVLTPPGCRPLLRISARLASSLAALVGCPAGLLCPTRFSVSSVQGRAPACPWRCGGSPRMCLAPPPHTLGPAHVFQSPWPGNALPDAELCPQQFGVVDCRGHLVGRALGRTRRRFLPHREITIPCYTTEYQSARRSSPLVQAPAAPARACRRAARPRCCPRGLSGTPSLRARRLFRLPSAARPALPSTDPLHGPDGPQLRRPPLGALGQALARPFACGFFVPSFSPRAFSLHHSPAPVFSRRSLT